MKKFLLMLQFLTTVPVPLKIDVNDRELGEGLVYAVLVGLLTGGLLAAFYSLCAFLFPALICAVLTNIAYIKLTGGLHLDGLGDTFDGIFSYRPKERILEIMKDSRVGSNAVIALGSILLLNTALFFEVDRYRLPMLLLMPVTGKMAIIIAAGTSRYARSEGGLGKSFIEYCRFKQISYGLALFILILTAGYILNILNLYIYAAGILSCLFAYGVSRYFSKKIEGVTGDILGAVCELTQTFFMILICAAERAIK